MKPLFANRRQLLLLGGLLLVLVLALVKMRSGSAPTARNGNAAPSSLAVDEDRPAAGRTRGGRAEKKVNPDDIQIITTKDLEAVASRQSSSARNLFDFRAPTPPPPPPPTPAPPPPPQPGSVVFVGPLPPPAPTPTPQPPEVTFKFLGTFGPKERPIAVLAQAGETLNAREGDVVFQHFVIRKIGYESIDVGFIGPWKDTRRVGLTQ